MTFPRLLAMIAVSLFSLVGLIALFKSPTPQTAAILPPPIEIELDHEVRIVEQKKPNPTVSSKPATNEISSPVTEVNRVEELFSVDGPKLPIVETIIYKSRVPWQQGRPAWLSDYARHYQTSRHFIARSLNGKPDYFKQDVADGVRFNVLKKDKNIQFYLLVDLARCTLNLYYDDMDNYKRVLLKTYKVGLGRLDGSKASGFLTPLGKYSLGNKTAIYRPKSMGHYRGEQTEMITVFGTRWIPFDKEIADCTAPAKGLGIHGMPWKVLSSGKREEDRSSLGKYESDGCIRMASEDVEEIFAIIITKPSIIEIVKSMQN